MEIQDLDTMVPEPKAVKFGGVEYRLPADLPMEIFLRLNKAGTIKNEDGTDDTVAQIDSLTDTLAELFVWELEEQGAADDKLAETRIAVRRVLMRRGTKYCFTLMQEIYRADEEDGAVEGADPTPPPVPQAAA